MLDVPYWFISEGLTNERNNVDFLRRVDAFKGTMRPLIPSFAVPFTATQPALEGTHGRS